MKRSKIEKEIEELKLRREIALDRLGLLSKAVGESWAVHELEALIIVVDALKMMGEREAKS